MAIGDALRLVLQIKSDSTQAQADVKKLSAAVSKELKEIDAASKVASGNIGGLSGAFSALLNPTALLAGGAIAAGTALVSTGKQALDAAGALYDLHIKTGFAVETLSALSLAGEKNGTTIQTLTVGLGIFEKNMVAAEKGNKNLAAAFKDLNISTTDHEKALRQAFSALVQMEEGEKQTAAAMQLFGKSGREILAVIKETNGDLDAAIEKYREMSLLISHDVAQAADELGDEMTAMGQGIKKAALEFITALAPALKVIITLVNAAVVAVRALAAALKFLFTNQAIDYVKAIGALRDRAVSTTREVADRATAQGAITASQKAVTFAKQFPDPANRGIPFMQDPVLLIRGMQADIKGGAESPLKKPSGGGAGSGRGGGASDVDLTASIRDAREAIKERDELFKEALKIFEEREKDITERTYKRALDAAKKNAAARLAAEDDYLNARLKLIDNSSKDEAEKENERENVRFEHEQKVLRIREDAEEERRKLSEQILKEEEDLAERRVKLAEDAIGREMSALRGLFDMTRQLGEARRDEQRKALEDAVKFAQRHTIITREQRAKFIAARAELDLEEEDARHGRIKSEISAQEAELKNLATTEAQKLEIERQSNALREQEKQRHENERQRITKQADEETGGGGLLGGLKEAVNDIPDLTVAEFGANAITIAFEGMKDAVLESVDAFVFFGATIGQVMRRAVAEILASIAKEAALQGIKQAALALASLAMLDFRGAALHAASSAMWFSIAGGAMMLGRSVAAPLYQQAGAGAGQATQRGTQTAANEVREINVDRRRSESPAGASANAGSEIRAAIKEELAPVLGGLVEVMRQYKPKTSEDVLVSALQNQHGNGARMIGETFVQQYQTTGKVREVIQYDGAIGAR
jgi:hypothetical protein